MVVREDIHLWVLFIIILGTRLYFLGSSLWHDDAFNFVDKALTLAATGIYDNAHSTGYPLWIFLLSAILKIGHTFTGQWSIIFLPNILSAILGSLLLFPLYRLAKNILQKHLYALLAVLITMLNPVLWRWSEIAMSDVCALLLALWSLVFQQQGQYKNYFLSAVFLILAMMIRPIYGIIILAYIVYILVQKNITRAVKSRSVIIYFGSILLTLLGYFLINNFSLDILFTSYGSTFPSLADFFGTLWIVLKSVGILFGLLSIVGFVFIFRQNRQLFYYLGLIFFLFLIYLSSWYHSGSFDIERYGLLLSIILILSAIYVLTINKIWKIIFYTSFFISLILLLIGFSKPAPFYRAYATDANIFKDYILKSAQISQQSLIDGDLRTYQDIASTLVEGDVIFYWQNDWAIPSLVFSDTLTAASVELVSIDSGQALQEKLEQYKGKKIFMLRGVVDQYGLLDDQKPLQSQIIGGRSTVYFLPVE